MKLKELNQKTENCIVEQFMGKDFYIDVKYNWLEKLILKFYKMKNVKFIKDNKIVFYLWKKYKTQLNETIFYPYWKNNSNFFKNKTL